jgi:pimeloyl-ACP methyl ester carboxylesterase
MQATINGVRTAYTDEGKGNALVFIHGFPLSRDAWQKQIDAFKGTHRVIAPDLRGLGESEAQAGTNSMAQYADDVHALLQHLNAGPIVLIAHSMGGYVALAYARKYASTLKGLVLVGTKAGADSPEAAAGRRATAEKVKAEGSKVVVDAMAPRMLAATNTDARAASQVRAFMVGSQPNGVVGALLGMAERPDSTEMLGSIRVPTLIITGADDVVIPPAESDKLVGAIPGAMLKVIPGAGHLVAFEKPEEFNATLKAWLPA